MTSNHHRNWIQDKSCIVNWKLYSGLGVQIYTPFVLSPRPMGHMVVCMHVANFTITATYTYIRTCIYAYTCMHTYIHTNVIKVA